MRVRSLLAAVAACLLSSAGARAQSEAIVLRSRNAGGADYPRLTVTTTTSAGADPGVSELRVQNARIKFTSAADGYLINVGNLDTAGIYYDAANGEWEWWGGGASRASLALGSGDFSAGGTVSAAGNVEAAGVFRISGDTVLSTAGSSNTFVGRSGQGGTQSTFLGQSAGSAATGSSNTYLGFSSGAAQTSGAQNVAVGGYADHFNAGGSGNVAVGYTAGYGLGGATSSSYSTMIGHQAGRSNRGSYNTFLGMSAAYSQTTGQQNVALGAYADYLNTSGTGNVAVGYQAGRGASGASSSYGVSLGYRAGYSNQANYNTFLGAYAGESTATSAFNAHLGAFAGRYQTGTDNVLLGSYAGQGLSGASSGSQNVLVGRSAGQSSTTGASNTAVGYQAGFSNQTGTGNVFLGHQAGYSETGSGKLYIANSTTSSPLIHGDFSAGALTVNGTLTVTGTVTASAGLSTGLTPGSVAFAGAGGLLAQDNANLFWDDASDRLGVGTSAPGYTLHVRGAGLANAGLALQDSSAADALWYVGVSGQGLQITKAAGTTFTPLSFSASGATTVAGSLEVGGTSFPSARVSVTNALEEAAFTGATNTYGLHSRVTGDVASDETMVALYGEVTRGTDNWDYGIGVLGRIDGPPGSPYLYGGVGVLGTVEDTPPDGGTLGLYGRCYGVYGRFDGTRYGMLGGYDGSSYYGVYGAAGAAANEWAAYFAGNAYVSGKLGIGVTPSLALEVGDRMRLHQGGAGSAGLWLSQTAGGDRAFVGMKSDTEVGFYGNNGAQWDFWMDTATGAVTMNAGAAVNGNLTVSGDLSADNMPGCDYSALGGEGLGTFSTAWSQISTYSVSLTAPSAGYVLVTHSGDVLCVGPGFYDIGIGTTTTSSSRSISVFHPHAAGTNVRYPFSFTYALAVSAGSVYTFYGVGKLAGAGQDMQVSDAQLTLIFVPKRY